MDIGEAHYNLAHALSALGQPHPAVRAFREALRLQPDWPAALRDLAELLATHPDAGVRDATEAVRLASRAVELVEDRAADQGFVMNERDDALMLSTLAAAYAAAGRFEDATRTAERAEAVASGSAPDLAAQIRAQRNRYRSGQPPFESER
jgi:spermidine synthase